VKCEKILEKILEAKVEEKAIARNSDLRIKLPNCRTCARI